jgi:plastocyanin
MGAAKRSYVIPHRTIMLAWLALAGLAHGEAIIEGTVALPKARTAPVVSRRYQVVTQGGVLALDPPEAVVYLEGSFPPPASPARAEMAQKNLAFVTPLLPVQVGTRVEFPNLDDTYHNIFSFSRPKRFDLGRYRSDERPIPSEIFDQPGLVALHCDIHEHMRAIILVLATPHFVKSDTAGHYRLTGLPAGHFTLKAWVDSKTTLERPVDLKSGGTLHLDFP